jgi:hypothetical protein
MHGYILWRLLPVLFLVLAAGFWFNDVQEGGDYIGRNLLPLFVFVALAALTLYKGEGAWAGAGPSWPLATLGFAIPVLGLSVYLHYAYSVNLNEMFSDAAYPDRIFRYLPVYTMGAGVIGFAIGWIVGRNV